MNWKLTVENGEHTAPENVTLMTKIDDEKGERNVHELKRRGNLWWTPDGEMYVYYRPTHYAEIDPSQGN
jgi:hypothetical protein